MDVTVSVYLAGGHVWQFVCDDADPMAVGLVSALPGAAAKGPVSADGLIQVEARTGERMYLTRQSLVAVSIAGRPPLLPALISASKLQAAIGLPSPFALVSGCFDEADELLLVGAVTHGAIGAPRSAVAAVEFTALPRGPTDHLLRAIAEARKLLAPGNEEAFLDLTVRIAGTGGEVELPSEQGADILRFAIVIPAAGGAVDTKLEIYDQDSSIPGQDGRSARSLIFPAGTLLALPAGVATSVLRPQLRDGEAIVFTGRLVKSAEL